MAESISVGIVMDSSFDWEIMQHSELTLSVLGIPNEVKIISAHRSPQLLYEYATFAEERGLKVIIAGASQAAHLPGMLAANTLLPVLGVPIASEYLQGLDALLSIVQMQAGTPVGTLGIGRKGAINAALLAAEIIGLTQVKVKEAIKEYRAGQTKKILDYPDPRDY